MVCLQGVEIRNRGTCGSRRIKSCSANKSREDSFVNDAFVEERTDKGNLNEKLKKKIQV